MTLGAILAGGSSQRMGTDKALVEVAGRPMIEWVARALTGVCDEAVVVGREGRLGGLTCLPDTQTRVSGPLAGLIAALEYAGGRDVLLVAADQPFVRVQTLQRILGEVPNVALVPVDEARQVTCALYPGSWAAAAGREIASEGSIQSLLDRLPHHVVEARDWRGWGEDGRSWFSVDTAEKLEEGLERFGVPG